MRCGAARLALACTIAIEAVRSWARAVPATLHPVSRRVCCAAPAERVAPGAPYVLCAGG